MEKINKKFEEAQQLDQEKERQKEERRRQRKEEVKGERYEGIIKVIEDTLGRPQQCTKTCETTVEQQETEQQVLEMHAIKRKERTGSNEMDEMTMESKNTEINVQEIQNRKEKICNGVLVDNPGPKEKSQLQELDRS